MLKFLIPIKTIFQKIGKILEKRKFSQRNKSSTVKKILLDVKNQGDKAVIRFEKNFLK